MFSKPNCTPSSQRLCPPLDTPELRWELRPWKPKSESKPPKFKTFWEWTEGKSENWPHWCKKDSTTLKTQSNCRLWKSKTKDCAPVLKQRPASSNCWVKCPSEWLPTPSSEESSTREPEAAKSSSPENFSNKEPNPWNSTKGKINDK